MDRDTIVGLILISATIIFNTSIIIYSRNLIERISRMKNPTALDIQKGNHDRKK